MWFVQIFSSLMQNSFNCALALELHLCCITLSINDKFMTYLQTLNRKHLGWFASYFSWHKSWGISMQVVSWLWLQSTGRVCEQLRLFVVSAVITVAVWCSITGCQCTASLTWAQQCIHGLVQERCNSSALAMKLCLTHRYVFVKPLFLMVDSL